MLQIILLEPTEEIQSGDARGDSVPAKWYTYRCVKYFESNGTL